MAVPSIPFVHSPGAASAGAARYTVGAAAYLAALRKKMLQTPGYVGGGAAGAPPPSGAAAGAPPVGHWDVPDYHSLIAADPTLMAENARIAGAGPDAGIARRAAAQQAIIASGFAPGGYQDQYGDIDAATLAAARDNPMSTLHQLEAGRSRSSADLQAALAGRGMLSSGALAGGEQRNLEGFQGAQATAAQQLLQALGGYSGQYASTMDELAQRRLQAEQNAALLQAMMNPPSWVDPSAALPPTAPPSGTEGAAPQLYWNPVTGQLQTTPPAIHPGEIWGT